LEVVRGAEASRRQLAAPFDGPSDVDDGVVPEHERITRLEGRMVEAVGAVVGDQRFHVREHIIACRPNDATLTADQHAGNVKVPSDRSGIEPVERVLIAIEECAQATV
jgi:hypothetical protein